MKVLKNLLLFIAVILSIGLIAFLAVPHFIKDGRTTPKNTCINHLRLIDGAIQEWALENNKTNSDIPTWADLKEYLGRIEIPKCPLGGTYTLGKVSDKPTCSIPGHALP